MWKASSLRQSSGQWSEHSLLKGFIHQPLSAWNPSLVRGCGLEGCSPVPSPFSSACPTLWLLADTRGAAFSCHACPVMLTVERDSYRLTPLNPWVKINPPPLKFRCWAFYTDSQNNSKPHGLFPDQKEKAFNVWHEEWVCTISMLWINFIRLSNIPMISSFIVKCF